MPVDTTTFAWLVCLSAVCGCSVSTTRDLPTDAGPMLGDAGSFVGPTAVDGPPIGVPCEAGFEADSAGACTRWTLLTGTPACFEVAFTTMRDARVLVLGNCHDPNASPPVLQSAFLFDPSDRSWRLWT